ncbi:MAG TPA: isoprenyl transferase [Candidatus Omnitrophota bacterium]|nr:isoprenyl transferase [Candidatus Omnitrophota bacterium]
MKVPGHIAVIMDGNRRWAEKNNVPHISGHSAGVKALDAVTEECAKRGVKFLTVYGFSIENWNRPRGAVESLFSLFSSSLERYIGKVKKNNIRFNTIGRISGLPKDLGEMLNKAVRDTASNTGLVLTAALNYGGRQEIVDAARRVAEDFSATGRDLAGITDNDIEQRLYTAGLPDPDLVIRTSGEIRVSNFLLWQSAYSEFYFTGTLWPDFGAEELGAALEEYGRRQRRYGG